MEENNLNSNNQMSTNNNTEQQIQPSKSNNMLIVLMALIIVGLAGYIVYSKFIQKNDNQEPKPNDTQEQENNNSNQNEENNNSNENNGFTNSNENNQQGTNNNGSTNVVGTTYKTKDGKKTLKILNKNGDGYSAEYNGIKLNVYLVNREKYSKFTGDRIDGGSQCGEYFLIVNNQTHELINLDYENENYNSYYIEHIGNKYYFINGYCGTYKKVYDESLNVIANEFVEKDQNGNFYAMKDGYITKFDSNGKIVKQSSIKPDNKDYLALDGASIIDNNFYALVEVGSKLYLYDFNKDTKIELNNPYKSYICPDGNCDDGIASMRIVDKKLLIILHPSVEQERVYQNDIAYLYTPSNSKLDSIGNFLTFDEDKEYGKGNFYLYDNTSLYKYDNSGNLVTKTAFDYNKVVYTAATHGFVAYKGNFFITIKENGEYYVQDAFNKDRYKIDMVDGYEFYSMYLVQEHKGDRYVATNIIEISLITGSDKENNVSFIKYKFNIDTKTMSK